MKKIMMTLALLLSMAWATPASAFGFDWGVTGGLNLTKLKVKGEKKNIFSSDNQAGWFIGPKAHLNLAMGFGLDGALLYSQQNSGWRVNVRDCVSLRFSPSPTFSYVTVCGM